jgi:hypothetical protein
MDRELTVIMPRSHQNGAGGQAWPCARPRPPQPPLLLALQKPIDVAKHMDFATSRTLESGLAVAHVTGGTPNHVKLSIPLNNF